jgi:hypothetical protein
VPHPASIADVASLATSLVTFALVVVTAFSVRVARKSANTASETAKLTAQQVQEAIRPLLIPDQPRQDGHEIDLPIKNIGAGPALRVFCRAQVKNQPPGVVGRFPDHVIPGVAAGDEAFLRLRFALADLTGVRITYVDAANRAYTTEAHWHDRLRRFTHTTVDEGDTARVPVGIARAGSDRDAQPG